MKVFVEEAAPISKDAWDSLRPEVIDRCGHGIRWGRYCPWCREWERGIEAEAARLRALRR